MPIAAPLPSEYIIRMSQDPTPLAPLVAGIAADVRAMAAQEAARAGLLAALHALIFATLARLSTTLEAMVTLWAAGLLPLPTPRKASPARQTATRPNPRAAAPAPFVPLCAGRHLAAVPPHAPGAHPISPSAQRERAQPSHARPPERPLPAPRARPRPAAAPSRWRHPAIGSARHTPTLQNALSATLPSHALNVTIQE